MPDELSESEPIVDDDLVVRARTDRDAFGELFDRYYSRVLRYCLRRLSDRAAAEDVTSEVFLRVAAHLRRFSGASDSDFRAWLFRIATNGVHAQLRQSLRRQSLWKRAAENGRLDAPAAQPPERTADDALDWPAVSAALTELSERDQSIVTLRFFADCSHAEIGAVVGLSEGAVRTALSRAIARLRERFNPSSRDV